MTEQGRKYDGGKLRYDLIPVLALEEVTRVITLGAEKYDPENWKNVPEGRRRYTAAAFRHIEAWRKGETTDEIGTHHIANAISNLMFILEKELRGWGDVKEEQVVGANTSTDSRWYPDDSGEWIEYDGSGQPVDDDEIVEALLREERKDRYYDLQKIPAWKLSWVNHGCGEDIVAYKIVKE